MSLSAFHPYVYYATQYPFAKSQTSRPRICYTSSLYLISKGTGILLTDGVEVPAVTGSLFYIPAGQPHDWIADDTDPMVHVCCYFDWHYIERQQTFDWASPICYDPSQLRNELVGPSFPFTIPLASHVESVRQWTDLFQSFYKIGEFTNGRTFMRSLVVQRNFQSFINHLLTFLLHERHIPDPRIDKLLKHLEVDLLTGPPRPLEVYYEHLDISRGHFFDLFKKTTGYTPIQYISRFRIGRAMEDLIHTNLSVTEISERYHFSSVHYFSRMFHKQAGVSPSVYRIMKRE